MFSIGERKIHSSFNSLKGRGNCDWREVANFGCRAPNLFEDELKHNEIYEV
jgi:hypothetical protein